MVKTKSAFNFQNSINYVYTTIVWIGSGTASFFIFQPTTFPRFLVFMLIWGGIGNRVLHYVSRCILAISDYIKAKSDLDTYHSSVHSKRSYYILGKNLH